MTGALGQIFAALMFTYDFGPDLLKWGLGPASLLGIGLSEPSFALWLLLIAINGSVFAIIGAIAGVTPAKLRFLVWLVVMIVLFGWCSWLDGMALLPDGRLWVGCVLFFYSVPFVVVVRARWNSLS